MQLILCRALPRTVVLVATVLIAAVAPLPRAANSETAVVVATDLVTSPRVSIGAGTTPLPLPGRTRFVALSWAGANRAVVTVSTSANGTTYGAPRDIGRDGVEIDGDATTWSGLLFAPGATTIRVTTDTPLRDLTVTSIADRAARSVESPNGAPAAYAAVAQPDVVSRAEWGADESLRDPRHAANPANFYPVQKLIVHHTGDDAAYVAPSPEEHIRAIYRSHTGSRGFSDIGYNFLVSSDGRIFEGRYARAYAVGEEPTGEDLQGRGVAGAHASNYNSGTAGIAVLGNFTSITPTTQAISALVEVLAWKADRHGIDPLGSSAYDNPSSSTDTPRVFPNIAGHRDIGSTECPGGQLYAMLPTIRQQVAARIAAGGPAPTPTPSQVPTPPPGGRFVPVTPSRLLDTRDESRPIVGGETRTLRVGGRAGVPTAGATAAVVNVTVIEPTRRGFVTIFPAGSSRPTASNLNFVEKQTVPNLVTVGLGSGGDIAIYSSAGATHVAVDIVGWYGDRGIAADSMFAPLTPARLLDTRDTLPIGPGVTRTLEVTGRGGVPASGVDAVVLNVTAIKPTTRGFLTVFPTGAARPGTSNLNLVPGQIRPNLVVAKVGDGGTVSIYNSSGSTDVAADVVGWYGPPVHSDGRFVPAGRFRPVVPGRALDTRSTTALGHGETRRLRLAGTAGVPASGAGAVVLNVTAVEPTSNGYLTVYPAGGAIPPTSSLNFTPEEVVPNLVVVGLSDAGEIALLNSSGTTHVVVDVVGWYTRD